jgi:hypothetical protein
MSTLAATVSAMGCIGGIGGLANQVSLGLGKVRVNPKPNPKSTPYLVPLPQIYP